MPRLLFVNASPRGARSESLRIAQAVLASAPARYAVDRLDLFADPLPPFATTEASAKMEVIAGEPVAPERADAWARVRATAQRLVDADVLLATVPMWNGGVPWALKLFIDTVTQPGLAFRFDPATGYRGLLGGRRAIAVYTSRVFRPGVPPAFGTDFHATYFDDWLRFVGIHDVAALRLQPTRDAPGLDDRRAAVLAQARAIGAAL